MRIAYVALGVEPKNMTGGVGRKIESQTTIWTEMGHTARLFALVPDYEKSGVYSYGATSSVPVLREITRAVSRSKALGRMLADVDKFQADVIYLRCGAYIFALHELFWLAPVVMELNTNDIAESAGRGRYAYWFNLLTRGILLRRAAGLVAVTQEIADIPENRRYGKPMRAIGNGIDLRQYKPLPAPKNECPVITLVGSPRQPWHGADKLIRLAEKCGDLKVDIVGYGRSDIPGKVPENVELHGFLDEAGVRGVLAKSDVACGSLAIHRTSMKEASSLKVREALAYGIPVMFGYRDMDFADSKSECILELPCTEDNVLSHAEQIRAFAYKMRGKRVKRGDVASRIDQRGKEETRVQFLEQVVENRRHAGS